MCLWKIKGSQNIKIVGPITFITVMLIWRVGVNLAIGYSHNKYNTDYTNLLIVSTVIPLLIILISSIIALLLIRFLCLNASLNTKVNMPKYINRTVLIVLGCILLFGLFTGYGFIPAVNNYAVFNNLGKDKNTVIEIIKEFKKIHLISTCVYTVLSALILYLTGLFYLKKLNK